jgi:rRNA maturation protein Nop10
MSSEKIDFFLPLGLIWEEKIYRTGHIHLATTLDELDIQNTDEVNANTRYRDIMLLSRVIDDFGTLNPVTVEMIENLFEADFLYLQLLYKELNGDGNYRVTSTCPSCGAQTQINIPHLYQDMSLYQQKEAEQG